MRHLVFYSPGQQAPFRITNQVDHTWFLTVFGEKNQKKPYTVDKFMEFVNKNYDEGALFEIGSYGVANDCCPTLMFTDMGIAHKFLADFTQILEELV